MTRPEMYADLLEQARHLALHDPRRPKQASLRRAISAAYYALFHFLLDQATSGMLGTQREVLPYRRAVSRAFRHGTMRKACKSFAGGTLTKSVLSSLPASFVIPPDLNGVARAVVNLQDYRHTADYDLSRPFTREET